MIFGKVSYKNPNLSLSLLQQITKTKTAYGRAWAGRGILFAPNHFCRARP
jgi:hypothetical protein